MSRVITVAEFIAELSKLPPDWRVDGTRSGRSVWVAEPVAPAPGRRYGYVFTDGAATRLYTTRTY